MAKRGSRPEKDLGAGISAEEARRLARSMMRRQAILGLKAAAVFLILVLGLPLLTQFAPEVTQTPIFGFPLAWFLLALAFYPITWALSAWFVRGSETLEADEARRFRESRP